MENYFNYFTEIEEHFQRRRGTGLLLSTLDWALIETWKDAGIPLEAALRGIDSTFDAYERRPSKTRKVNSLAYCSQEVLAAAEDMKEAAVGTSRHKSETPGLESSDIEKFFRDNAAMLRQVQARDYNPPRRERILQWQAEQEFPILPDPSDPDCGNVYKTLKFPNEVYEHIENYQVEKAEANS